MKLKSFRFRIALLSALLAATAIAGFSGITYYLFYQSKINTIDNEIKDQLSRESSAPRPLNHWQTYEKIQASFFGDQTEQKSALLVIDNEGKVIHQSKNWQTEFAPDFLSTVETVSSIAKLISPKLPPPRPPFDNPSLLLNDRPPNDRPPNDRQPNHPPPRRNRETRQEINGNAPPEQQPDNRPLLGIATNTIQPI